MSFVICKFLEKLEADHLFPVTGYVRVNAIEVGFPLVPVGVYDFTHVLMGWRFQVIDM